MVELSEAARPATVDDLEALTQLAAEAVQTLSEQKGGHVWSLREARTEPYETQLRADIDNPDTLVAVGVLDEQVFGYGVIKLESLHDQSQIGIISDIYVSPDARGVGLGEGLVDLMLNWATDRGCVGVDSLALPGDRHTKNFFESHGLVARAIVVHRSLTLN